MRYLTLLPVLLLAAACSTPRYDVILRGGTIYDGLGGKPMVGDVVIDGDRVVLAGGRTNETAEQELDVRGMAVAPGFINMLSWATETLIEDARSQSDIRQGVTLEVFGEGWSMALADLFKLWIGVILPLLLAAAFLEIYVTPFIVFAALGVFLGGRLGYVLFYNLPFYLENPLKSFGNVKLPGWYTFGPMRLLEKA